MGKSGLVHRSARCFYGEDMVSGESLKQSHYLQEANPVQVSYPALCLAKEISYLQLSFRSSS